MKDFEPAVFCCSGGPSWSLSVTLLITCGIDGSFFVSNNFNTSRRDV